MLRGASTSLGSNSGSFTAATDLISVVAPRPGWYLAVFTMNVQRSGNIAHHYINLTDSANVDRVSGGTPIQISGSSASWWTYMLGHHLIYVSERDLVVKVRGQSDTAAIARAGGTSLVLLPAWPEPTP